MNHAEHNAKTPFARDAKTASPRTGFFATLAHLLHGKGSGAPATKRAALGCVAVAMGLLLPATSAQASYPAQGNFGLNGFDVTFTEADGTPARQAGSHPFAITTVFKANLDGEGIPEGRLRDFLFTQVPGLVGDTTAYPRCSTLDFLEVVDGINTCPLDTTVGISANEINAPGSWFSAPVFNLTPPPGVLLRLGFRALVENIVIDVGISTEPPYLPTAGLRAIPQLADVFSGKTQLWGDPSDPRHDELRGPCGSDVVDGLPPQDLEAFQFEGRGVSCPTAPRAKPFLTLPTTCAEPLLSSYRALSWEGDVDTDAVFTHEAAGNPAPFVECAKLGFGPTISARPSTRAAQSPTGLDFSLDVSDEGLTSVEGHSQSDIRKAVVTLPEGMTVNPSQAEGLGVCTEADLEAETLSAQPGEGCPQASKIGTVEVESPLVQEAIDGALYVAEPYHNLAADSLIAVYLVFKSPKLGIIVKQPLKVEPDPETGRLTTVADGIPQLPFSHFRLHFREGGRSPLISPPRCGSHEVKAVLTPWSGGKTVEATSAFQIISGPNEGPCPPGGVAPFHPGFEAGSINNSAGAYSPFDMRLTRNDGEQDMTKFSAVLPPGVVGKIAGVSKCSEAAIAAAKARTGPHGGQEEIDAPSCPASSKIGRTLAGAGVGSQLTYVPGSLYLAGPVAGDPLSVVSITPALAGPFDAGTVVVRVALTLNPATAEVEVDGSHSDPIPHILKGIPLNVRDLRVYADKPNFTINPTDCEPSAAKATLFGSFLNVFDPADDLPVGLQARYQAANCAALGFKPKLQIKLKGGTKRGGHPALKAEVTPRPGDANFAAAAVTLPHSAFLDQAHIRTICTRVQFAERGGNGAGCPEGAIYGQATATSPLLDEPLSGPVYLRSSDHNLPDLVVALHGLVDINLASRIDSRKGGIRSSFEGIPDAPVSKFVLEMQGGRKGLIVNSTNLCRSTNRAKARFVGQNGKAYESKPAVGAKCPKKHKGKAKHKRHGRQAAR